MIRVVYDGLYSLSVEGHAGQAPAGKDIVCAGVSTLLYSLAQMLAMHEDQCLQLDLHVESGSGYVTVEPSLFFEATCQGAFEAIVCGLYELAKDYPDYVSFVLNDEIMDSPPEAADGFADPKRQEDTV